MKAISLLQPWATLVALKLKTIETRTHGRFASLWGERVAIHAAKKIDEAVFSDHHIIEMILEKSGGPLERLTHVNNLIYASRMFAGKILCTAQVFNARWAPDVDFEMRENWNKQALCEVAGKYCLFLGDIKILKKPIPYKGRQGIFEVPEEVINDQQ